MDWFSSNPQLTIALLSPLLFAIAYFYKAHVDRQGNLHQALYLLLEIWHRMTAASASQRSDIIFNAIFERIKQKIPQQEFPEGYIEGIKSYYAPLAVKGVKKTALEGFDDLHSAYANAVTLISRSDPILAYRLDSAPSIRKRLASLDGYLNEAFDPITQQDPSAASTLSVIKEKLGNYAEDDGIADIEKSLRRLACQIGLVTYLRVRSAVSRRHKQMRAVDRKEVDRLVDALIMPFIPPQQILKRGRWCLLWSRFRR